MSVDFFKYCKEGKIDMLESFEKFHQLDKETFIKIVNTNQGFVFDNNSFVKFTSLMIACHFNHIEVVKFLLKFVDEDNLNAQYKLHDIAHDYDIELPENDIVQSALIIAVRQGNVEIVKILLNDPRLKINYKEYWVCLNRYLNLIYGENDNEISQSLIKRLISDSFNNDLAWKVGYEAIEKYDIQVLKAILEIPELGSNILNHINEDNFTILMCACQEGTIKCVRLILNNSNLTSQTLNHRCNNFPKKDSVTAFQIAYDFKFFDIVEEFLRFPNVDVEIEFDDANEEINNLIRNYKNKI
jgi:ankyrin repeat protein